MMLIEGGLAHVKPISDRYSTSDTFSDMVRSLVGLLRRLDARIVGFGPEPGGAYIDWCPTGADPECPPMRSSIARRPAVVDPLFEDLEALDPDDELELLLDAPALAAIAARAELRERGIVDLADRRR